MISDRVSKGEWKAVRSDKTRVYCEGYAVCVMTGGECTRDKANANLMSASKDMYKALEDCVNALINDGRRGGVVMEQAKEALEKARGKS